MIEWKGGNSYQGGTNSYRGRGNSYPRSDFHGNCFRCGKEGHTSFESRSFESGQNNRNVMILEDIESLPSGPKVGESLMVRRTLCNKGSNEEPILRRSLFKTRCKILENVAK